MVIDFSGACGDEWFDDPQIGSILMIPTFTIHSGEFLVTGDFLISVVCDPLERHKQLSEDDCSWLLATTAVAAAKTFGPPVAAACSPRNNRHWVCMCGSLGAYYLYAKNWVQWLQNCMCRLNQHRLLRSSTIIAGAFNRTLDIKFADSCRFEGYCWSILIHIVSCTELAETTKSCQQNNTWHATTQLSGVWYKSDTVIRFLEQGVLLYTHIATWHGSMATENLGQMFDFPSALNKSIIGVQLTSLKVERHPTTDMAAMM